MFHYIVQTLYLLPIVVSASVQHHPSGLMRNFESDPPKVTKFRSSEKEQLGLFIEEQFEVYLDEFSWTKKNVLKDKTHHHHLYSLKYKGRPVVDKYLKIHFSKKGWVQYASNSWQRPFRLNRVPTRRATYNRVQQVKLRYERMLEDLYGEYEGAVEVNPVVWMDDYSDRVAYALEVKIAVKKPLIQVRRFYLDEFTDELLEEKRMVKTITNKVYPIHPDRTGLTTVTLLDPTDASKLLNATVNVKRDNGDSTVSAPNKQDITPDTDYSGVSGFTQDPVGSTYDFTCTPTTSAACRCNETGATACPNHSFDGVNIYHHITTFRQKLDGYFTSISESPALSDDPIPVTVNAFSLDLFPVDGTEDDDTNNAFYLDATVTGIGRVFGLFFLRPTEVSVTGCDGTSTTTTVSLFDVAREALVPVHEYQHYITDKITSMVAGSSARPKVSDALHEAYSDYFGSSHISDTAGASATLVGEYAWQQCAALQRNIGTLTVLSEDLTYLDAHVAGIPFSSGLWQLRTDLGVETADLLALKSLFFLSTDPTWFESVEALVRADEAINAGANVSAIRSLFYGTLKFHAAAGSVVFQDQDNFIIETGFNSCGSLQPLYPRSRSLWITALLFLTWYFVTIKMGRAQWVK